MRKLISLIFIITPFFLVACDRDKSFSSSENGETVLVKVRLPLELEVLPLRVMYRSTICLKKNVDSRGKRYDEPGYNLVRLIFKPTSDNNAFELLVPENGGGVCRWKLSNITIRMQIKDTNFLDSEITKNVPISELIIFDDNSPQRMSGSYKEINGKYVMHNDYYPLITHHRVNGDYKTASIIRSTPDLMYKTNSSKTISFEPSFHSRGDRKSVV